jgi:site-specific DNA-methyltransferase (adenine-specific)
MLSRIKFSFDPLVEEILDQIPESEWTSKTSTWLDPAIGGGQFVRAIEARLARYGHSKKNIAKRVFGFEESDLHIRYAINKYKLVGNYTRMKYQDFLEKDMGMKFDNVVGNPPFDGGRSGSEGKIWPLFIDKAFTLTKENGYCSLITPTSWTSGSKTIIKGSRGVLSDILAKNIVLIIDLDVSKHFNVSTTAGYFIAKKSPPTLSNQTTIYMNNDFIEYKYLPSTTFLCSPKNETISEYRHKASILSKIFLAESFSVLPLTGAGKNRKLGENTPTEKKYIRHYVRGGNYDENISYAFFDTIMNEKYHKAKKVIIHLDGADVFKPYIDTVGIPFCSNCYLIQMPNEATTENGVSVFYSKLFKFLVEGYRTSGFIPYEVVKKLPKVDLTRSWTDQELYQHFGLTQEEIDYIESTVK